MSIKDAAVDTLEIRKCLYSRKGENTVKQLKKNGFEAYYVHTSEEAHKLLMSLIDDGSTVAIGDSQSVFSLELDDALEEKNCRVIFNKEALNLHRYYADESKGYIKRPTREETRQVLADYMTSNVYLLGANAITMTGEIVNVDGVGNRIATSLYGPDKVIVVAGVNKLVPDERSARERIQFIAAPMNKIKYGTECPCVKTGVCADCHSPERSCNITTVIHRKPIESDFHVIIVGEEMGF